MSWRLYLGAAGAVLRRDFTVFTTYRLRLVTQNVGIVFSLAVFYFVAQLVRVPQFPTPDAYFEYAAVGVVILQMLQSTLEAPTLVRQELVAGTFERMLLSPLGPVGGVLSLFLFPTLYAVVVMITSLGISAVLFGLDVHWATAPLALPVALLGSLAFSSFALVFAALVVAFKQAPGVAYVVALISLVSGLYFPPELLPSWLRWLSDIQPFTPAVDLLRHLLLDTPLDGNAWGQLAKVIGFSAILFPIGMATLVAAVRYGRRRGSVTEY